MTDAYVIDVLTGALAIAAKLAGPILLVSLIIGVVISLVQTVLQIQEMTLTFVPKLVGIAVVLVVAGGWMIAELVSWVQQLWATIPQLT